MTFRPSTGAASPAASSAARPSRRAQAKSLAFNPAIVWVPHPIQNRTEAELAGLAENAMAGILAMITP